MECLVIYDGSGSKYGILGKTTIPVKDLNEAQEIAECDNKRLSEGFNNTSVITNIGYVIGNYDEGEPRLVITHHINAKEKINEI